MMHVFKIEAPGDIDDVYMVLLGDVVIDDNALDHYMSCTLYEYGLNWSRPYDKITILPDSLIPDALSTMESSGRPKYITFEQNVVVIFSGVLWHKDVSDIVTMGNLDSCFLEPINAGFIDSVGEIFGDGVWGGKTYGVSEAMGLRSNPERDRFIIHKLLYDKE